MHSRSGIALTIALLVLGIQHQQSQFPKGLCFWNSLCFIPERKNSYVKNVVPSLDTEDKILRLKSYIDTFDYEGAVKEDGRGQTIWDTFSHSTGIILDRSNADVAVDQYHRYIEDIQLMKDMGMDAYRFSIACRSFSMEEMKNGENGNSFVILGTDGSGEINQAGTEPYVTLYHWDLPQALEDKYLGWLDRQIIKDFALYAETCFEKFGDRVKHWITFNEPHSFSIQGYYTGFEAPGRCSTGFCRFGNSSTEPYIVAHNVLLSHAAVVDIYRKNYKDKQNGSIGISLDVKWYVPETNAIENIEETQRAQDFQLGWFLDPLIFGDYPSSMRSRIGTRLPTFTESESSLLEGSLDFVGINHYTTYYASENATNTIGDLLNDVVSDANAYAIPFDKDGKPIGDVVYDSNFHLSSHELLIPTDIFH
ncbi:putative beta-glucosidase 41 [Hibiscus syriacus]|uniref:Beta-glucosidase 41 n=1 Tax=Hibiscus syriacus TaxID=106335 RepID=A0A6A2YUR6_HIBSY|nr:putative beta-glucosidase 41 [Hibiscus syriacus]